MNALFAQAQPGQLTQQQMDEINKISYGPIGIASMLVGLIFLVCLIMVIVKMFQNGQTGLGIVTIITSLCCGIGPFIALIMGWVKSGEWNAKTLMLIYTIVFLLYLGLAGYQYAQIIPIIQQGVGR